MRRLAKALAAITAVAAAYAAVRFQVGPAWLWHPLGQCAGTSTNPHVALHEVIRCKSYNFHSGIGANIQELTLLAGISGWWHHVNCIEPGCWRKGHKDPEHGHPLCTKHQDKLGDHPVRTGAAGATDA